MIKYGVWKAHLLQLGLFSNVYNTHTETLGNSNIGVFIPSLFTDNH